MTISTMKRLILVIGIGLLLGLGSLGYIWWQLASAERLASTVGVDCLASVATQQQCWTDAIVGYVSQHPEDTNTVFTGFYQLVRSGDLAVDARIFSDPAHQAGMTLLQQGVDFDQALIWCGDRFKGACRHGVVMEYADTYLSGEISSQNFVLCDDMPTTELDCIHGLGHSIVSHTSSQSLEDALLVCGELLDSSAQSACASGVLMEYSTGEMGLGRHSHEPVYTLPLPCKKLTADSDYWGAICYASAGSYRQYYPNQESWSDSFAYCDSIKSISFSKVCHDAVYERLLLSVAYDI